MCFGCQAAHTAVVLFSGEEKGKGMAFFEGFAVMRRRKG